MSTRSWTVALSVMAHAALCGGVVSFAFSEPARHVRIKNEPTRTLTTLELPIMLEETPSAAEAPMLAAGERVPRIDNGAAGHGGTATASEQAVHFAAQAEAQTFNQELLNTLEQNQVTRVSNHAREHVSKEDDRMTPNPMELTFVTRGHGAVHELRKEGKLASLGLAYAPAPVRTGDHGVERERTEGEGESLLGAEVSRAGQGIRSADRERGSTQTAPIATARPDVKQGAASVPAAVPGRTQDTTDSDQRVADAVRSIVQGSAFGGAKGEGSGGSAGAADPGAGAASGAGAHPTQLGEGGVYDLDSRDPNFMPYFGAIKRRIEPHVQGAVPREAIVELKQGYLILDVQIAKSGAARVIWPPVRSSGIAEFDENCAAIVRRVAPFGPIPEALGRDSLRVRLRLRFTQPI